MDDDFNLIRSLAEGQKEAFGEIYKSYCEKVYNTAISFTQNVNDAEEVTQDVFVKIFQYAAKFKGDSSLSTWIYRISVNTSLNFLKRKKRFSFIKFGQTDTHEPDFQHPGVLLERREEAKYLFKAIACLPDNQRSAFILSFIEQLPRQEVSDIMKISLKAVESLLQRAKHNLRKKLKEFYPERRIN